MKPKNLSAYESVQWDLARYRGLQHVFKARRKSLGKTIASCHDRWNRNGGQYDGRDLVPRQAAKDLIRATVKLGELERDIHANRIRIRNLEGRLTAMRIAHYFRKTLEQTLRQLQPPTPRQALQQILRLQGLHIHDNNEISGPGGKLVGWYGDDARYVGSELKWTFKPVQALDFIVLDFKLEDVCVEQR